jgi:hypothetical protein
MLGVEVDVIVGNSRLTRVSKGMGVEVGLLEIGVSSSGVMMDGGTSVVSEAGRLQDDTPMRAVTTAIQKRFLILSSFSRRMVLVDLRYCNSPSVFLKTL